MSMHPVVRRAGVVLCALAALIMVKATSEAQERDATAITGFREAIAQLDMQDQRDLFNGMAPEMRLALWQNRLRSAANSVKTADQKTVLQTLSNALTVGMYADRSAAGVAESTEFTAVWTKMGPAIEKAFERDAERLDTILTRLGDAKPIAGSIAKGSAPPCTCSTKFNGSLRANDCGSLSKACVKGDCQPTSFGCGILWLWSCDGLCKN